MLTGSQARAITMLQCTYVQKTARFFENNITEKTRKSKFCKGFTMSKTGAMEINAKKHSKKPPFIINFMVLC
jgi:hypothetical protein